MPVPALTVRGTQPAERGKVSVEVASIIRDNTLHALGHRAPECQNHYYFK